MLKIDKRKTAETDWLVVDLLKERILYCGSNWQFARIVATAYFEEKKPNCIVRVFNQVAKLQ